MTEEGWPSRIVGDASSVIYLAKSGLLRFLTQTLHLMLPQAVVGECLSHASMHHGDADQIQTLLNQGLIKLIPSKSLPSEKSKLGAGEEAVCDAFEDGSADQVLTDDGEAVKFCRQKGIPFLSSLFIPSLLYEKGLLNFSEALAKIHFIGGIGYFSQEIIHTARKRLFSSPSLKGVLFDLDGVLVDTMKLHDEAWRKAIAKYGLEVSKEEIYRREGEKGTVTAHDLLVKAGQNPYPEMIQNLIFEKEKIFKKYPKAQIFPGAFTCVEFLHRQGHALALVTGSFLAEVQVTLPDDFLKLFKAVITADSVHYGKPHPEPYLLALEKLGLRPSQAVVIENAPYGIRSAKAAGLACVAVETSLPRSYLLEADWVVKNLKEMTSCFGGV